MARVIKVWNATTSAWEDVAVQQPDTAALETIIGAQAKADAAQAAAEAYSDSAVSSIDLSAYVQGDGISDIVALTQAEYDALTPDASTLYVITD